MQTFGLVKDGGEVIEGVTVQTYDTEQDRAIVMGHIISRANDDTFSDDEKLNEQMQKDMPAFLLASARRRWGAQGMHDVRPFPVEV